jgi:hypothetical protein
MAEPWTPTLHVRETENGCRLTLAGIAHGEGETLQDAADDLILRLLEIVMGQRSPGLRLVTPLGPPDRRVLDFIWELGEMTVRGQDIRERVFGFGLRPDRAA